MQFSVIYEVDCGMDTEVEQFLPLGWQKKDSPWEVTEKSDGEPSDWCGEIWDGKVHHRKLCAILDEEQFEKFVFDTGCYAEDVETMGSLGAPGYGYGWAPAISFRNDDPEAIQSAYVTPSGTKAELVKFMQDHEVEVPAVLLDHEDQKYLWEEAVDQSSPWDVLRRIVIDKFSS